MPHQPKNTPVEDMGAPPKGDHNAGTEHLLQFFEFGHLPDKLAEISRPYKEMAEDLVQKLPRNPERTTALRKLLESKDCAVRAALAE